MLARMITIARGPLIENISDSPGVLFPYGETFGDQVLNGPIGVDQTQKPLNISCPFFGIQQDTIYVSVCTVVLIIIKAYYRRAPKW